MATNIEIVPFSYAYISPEALAALQEAGIEVEQDNGYRFEVPRSECSWDSDDNGGSYDMIIKGRKFWLDCNGEQGLQLDEK